MARVSVFRVLNKSGNLRVLKTLPRKTESNDLMEEK